MDWNYVIQNGLLFGAFISIVMTAMIIISARVNAEMWIGDAPPEVKAKLPPISDKARRQRALFAYPTFAILIGLIVYAVVRVYQSNGGFPGFWPVAATIWIAMQTFNLVDLLLIDWLLLETIHPALFVLPGTEEFENRRFYLFHFQGFLKGFVGITLVSLLVALVLTAINRIL